MSISKCTWSSFPPNSINLQRQLSRIPENTFSAYERIFGVRTFLRLKKKNRLGQELAEVTHGEKEIRRIKGNTFSAHPSLNRETPTTRAATI